MRETFIVSAITEVRQGTAGKAVALHCGLRAVSLALLVVTLLLPAGQAAERPDRLPLGSRGLSRIRTMAMPAAAPQAEPLRLRSESFIGLGTPADNLAAVLEATPQPHVIVQFARLPDDAQRERLAGLGVRLLEYLPDRAFFAGFAGPIPADEWPSLGIRWLGRVYPTDRLSPRLQQGTFGAWAQQPDGNVRLVVKFFADVQPDERRPLLEAIGARVVNEASSRNHVTIDLPPAQLSVLAGLDEIRWVEEIAPPSQPTLDGVRASIQSSPVEVPPYTLTGAGVVVGVWDVGLVDATHPDFAGRIEVFPQPEGPGMRPHATHVAGIVGGSGGASVSQGGGERQWRGIAPGVSLLSFDDQESIDEHGEAIATRSLAVSQNSWGVSINNFYGNCGLLGDYSQGAPDYDSVINGSLFGRPVTVVFAAGNARKQEENSCPAGPYGLIGPPSTAKNVLTVGAIYSDTGAMTPFSSWGPTDDGRVKPEIVAAGAEIGGDGGVTSTYPGGGYRALQGTSMATPAVSGVAALLIEDHRRLFNGQDPLPSTVRALLLHSALDLDDATDWFNPGPDYASGFGRVRAKEAVDLLRRNGVVVGQLVEAQTNRYRLSVPAGSPAVKLTLVWDDAAGAENAEISLVNDLDLVVIDPAGKRHFPWTLDPANPARPATRDREDHLNVVEQVFVGGPVAAGEWLVEVIGHNVPEGPVQKYSLAFTPGGITAPSILALDHVQTDDATAGFGDGPLDPGETIQAQMRVKNTDGPAATGVRGRLVAESDGVDILVADSNYPDIPPGAVRTNITLFSYRLAKSLECGSSVVLRLELKLADGTGYTNLIRQRIGRFALTNVATNVFDRREAPLPIPDGGGQVTSTNAITVPGLLRHATVSVRIDHPWVGDLQLTLEHPDGTLVPLVSADAMNGRNLGAGSCQLGQKTTFDDDAPLSIRAGTSPYSGRFRPEGDLISLLGRPINGDWKLRVRDVLSEDAGALNCWNLKLEYEQSGYVCRVFNRAPVVADATYDTPFELARSFTLSGFDPDEDPVEFVVLVAPQHGSMSAFDPRAGSFIYTPATGYSGPDQVQFVVRDGLTQSAVGALHLNVLPAQADLALGFRGLERVVIGELFTNRITVTNLGPNRASAVVVTNLLPPGFEVISLRPGQGTATVLPGAARWAVGDLVDGGKAAAEIVLRALLSGACTNVAQAWATEFDPRATNNAGVLVQQANTVADLALGQTAQPARILVGQTTEVVLTVTNLGPTRATQVWLTNELPDRVTLLEVQGAVSKVVEGRRVLALLGDLEVGGLATLRLSLRGNTEGPTTNLASVASTKFDFAPANNLTQSVIQIVPPVDLAVWQSFSPPLALARQEVVCLVAITNLGPATATAVQLTDVLPAGFRFVGVQPQNLSATADKNRITVDVGNLAAGAGRTVELVLVPSQVGTFTNHVEVAPGGEVDPLPANNSASVVIPVSTAVDLAVSLQADLEPAPVGRPLGWSIVVTNKSLTRVPDVVVTNSLPAGVTLSGITASQGTVRVTGSTVVASLGELVERGTAVVRVVWKPSSLGPLTNRAEVASALIETNAADNVAFAVANIRPETDLAVSLQNASSTVALGGETVIGVAVTNRGPATAAGWLTVEFPTNLAVLSVAGASGSATVEGSMIRLELIALPAGADVRLAVRVLGSTAGDGPLRAVVTATDADPQPADNTSTAVVRVRPLAELALAAPALANPAYFGRATLLTAVLTNQGPHAAEGVVVTNVLPPGLKFLSALGSQGDATNTGGTVVFRLGAVPPDSVVSLEVRGEPSALGPMANTWSVSSAVLESNLTDNVAAQMFDVRANADLVLTASPTGAPIVVEREFEVAFAITNHGPNSATGVRVAGTLPPGLEMISISAASGEASSVSGAFEVRWEEFGVGSNDVVRLKLWGVSTGAADLRAVAVAAETDLQLENNQCTWDIVVMPDSDLAVSAAILKPAESDPIFAGQPMVLGLGITNAGPRLAPAVWLRGFLPPGLVLTSTAPEGLPMNRHEDYVQVQIGDVPAGGVTNVQFIVIPTTDGRLSSRFEVGAAAVDEAPANNFAELAFTAQPSADLAVRILPSRKAVGVGREFEFHASVTNRGPSAVNGVNAAVFWQGVADLLAAEPDAGTVEPAEVGLRWTIGRLEPGGEARLVLRLQADSTGEVQAAVSAAGTGFDPDSGNDAATVTVSVREETGLVMTVAPASTNLALDGEWVQWITLTNIGPTPAVNVVLTNLLPASGTLLSAEADGGSILATDRMVLLAVRSLPVNAGTSLRTRWQPAVIGTLTSFIQVGSDGINVGNDTATATAVAHVVPHAELGLLRLAIVAPILHQAETTLRLAVTNAGPHPAPSVKVNVDVPAGLDYVEATAQQGTVVKNGSQVEFTFAALAPASAADLTLTVRGATPGSYTNRFQLHADVADSLPRDDQLEVPLTVIPVSDLVLGVTPASTNIAAGADFQLTLTVTNRGTSPATTVSVTNTMPPGVTFIGASGGRGTNRVIGKAVIWSVGELPVGEGTSQVLTLRTSRPGPITNVVQTGSAGLDPFPTDNSVATVLAILPAADLGVALTVTPQVVPVRGEVVYTLTVTNGGPLAATGLRLTNQLPSNLSILLLTADAGSTLLTGRELVWTLDRLAGGAGARMVLRARLDTLGTFPVTSTATAAEPDPNLANNVTTVSGAARGEADLGVTTLTYDQVFVVGQVTEYQVDITNHGPTVAPGVEVTNPLPPGMKPVEVATDQGTWSVDGNALVWRLGSVAAGGTFSAVFRAVVLAEGLMTNRVQIKGEVLDLHPQNDTTVSVTRAYLPVRLSVTATNTPGPYLVDLPVFYTLTVTNESSTPAPGVNLLAAFSDNMEIMDAESTRGTPQEQFSGIVTAMGVLPPGEGATLRIEVRPLTAGDLYCVVTGYSPAADPIGLRIILPVLSAPSISYAYLGNRLTLTWPSVAASYVLESADSLVKPVWARVPTPPVVTDDKLTVVVKVSGAGRFYRLHKAP